MSIFSIVNYGLTLQGAADAPNGMPIEAARRSVCDHWMRMMRFREFQRIACEKRRKSANSKTGSLGALRRSACVVRCWK